MVHFPVEVIDSYLRDAMRVLQPGGRALFHHSNYGIRTEEHYGRNPHARNFMPTGLFRDLATRAGFMIEESRVIPWGGVPDLDCVTLLRTE